MADRKLVLILAGCQEHAEWFARVCLKIGPGEWRRCLGVDDILGSDPEGVEMVALIWSLTSAEKFQRHEAHEILEIARARGLQVRSVWGR